MELSKALRRGFDDELEKISTGGFSRAGIRPFKASTLAGKAGKFVKKNFLTKTSGMPKKPLFAAATAGAAGALYGQRKLRQAAEDYQVGRQLRKQQQGG